LEDKYIGAHLYTVVIGLFKTVMTRCGGYKSDSPRSKPQLLSGQLYAASGRLFGVITATAVRVERWRENVACTHPKSKLILQAFVI